MTTYTHLPSFTLMKRKFCHILHRFFEIYMHIYNNWLDQTTQVHYFEFHAFDNHQVYIYFTYFLLKEK